MLEHIYNEYRKKAEIINWKDYNINELFFEYIKNENEPISDDHPFLKMDQVIVVPHIGSSSIATRDKMVQLCVDNAKQIMSNQEPITPVKLK